MRLFEILFQESHSVCQGAEVFLCKRMHHRRKVERNIPCRRQCFENVSSQKTGPRTKFQHRKTSGIQGTQFLSDGIKELDAPRPFLRCGLSPISRGVHLAKVNRTRYVRRRICLHGGSARNDMPTGGAKSDNRTCGSCSISTSPVSALIRAYAGFEVY